MEESALAAWGGEMGTLGVGREKELRTRLAGCAPRAGEGWREKGKPAGRMNAANLEGVSPRLAVREM